MVVKIFWILKELIEELSVTLQELLEKQSVILLLPLEILSVMLQKTVVPW